MADKNKKVIVGMSGGVDSSVTALVLKQDGYDVIGITMQFLSERFLTEAAGTAHYEDAASVARKLGIPHETVDLSRQFQETIIDDFCNEYLNGRTPNPCVRCNRLMKFSFLLKKMKELGAGYIATGHYARVVRDDESCRWYIKKAADRKKDQSYFLYMLTQDILRHATFPLGEFTKDEVRRIAKESKLSVHRKDESQEICFIEGKDYRPLFKGCSKPGPLVDREGNILGTHTGIADYTLGQRKGLGISVGKPLYVVEMDTKKNTIVVGEKSEAYQNELVCGDVNWISPPPSGPLKTTAKIRSLHRGAAATLYPIGDGRILLRFSDLQWAITPGQSAVFYDADTVLGGGTIESSSRSG